MATGIFRPTYPPPGMTFKDARAAGVLRVSDVWWIRYRAKGRTIRESAHTTRFEDARKLLNERRRAADRHEVDPKRKLNRVTFAEMAERLRAFYREHKQHLPTLDSRLTHLQAFFGARRMVDLGLGDVADYKAARLADGVSNGTLNRELEVLARAFSLGRELEILTVMLPVRQHRLAEGASA